MKDRVILFEKSDEEMKIIREAAKALDVSVEEIVSAVEQLALSANRATLEINKLNELTPIFIREPKKGGKRKGTRRWRNGKR